MQVNVRVHGQLTMKVSCSYASSTNESLLVKHVLKNVICLNKEKGYKK